MLLCFECGLSSETHLLAAWLLVWRGGKIEDVGLVEGSEVRRLCPGEGKWMLVLRRIFSSSVLLKDEATQKTWPFCDQPFSFWFLSHCNISRDPLLGCLCLSLWTLQPLNGETNKPLNIQSYSYSSKTNYFGPMGSILAISVNAYYHREWLSFCWAWVSLPP